MKKNLKKQLMCAGMILGLGALTACGNNQTKTMKQEETAVEAEPSSVPETQEQVTESISEIPSTEDETQEEMTTVYLEAKGSVYSNDSWNDETKEYQYENEYDENGKLLKIVRNNMDGSSYVSDKYAYDADYAMLKHITYNADGSIKSGNEWEYDTDGREIRELSYNADGTTYLSREREDSADGKGYKWLYYNADGTLTDAYEHDENDNCVKHTNYEGEDEYGGCTLSTESEYDKNGNIVKNVSFNPDGSMDGIEEWKYNEDGLVLSNNKTYYDGGQVINTYVASYEYDERGEELRYTRMRDGKLYERTEHIYDDKGNLIKIVEYGSDDSIHGVTEVEYNEKGIKVKTKVTYLSTDSMMEEEYDEHGNAVRFAIYDSGVLQSLYESEYIEMQIPKKFAPEDSTPFNLL